MVGYRVVDARKAITAADDVRQALYASKITSYAQGYVQLDAAAQEFGWDLDNGQIALLWRGGCIIRATFLENINPESLKVVSDCWVEPGLRGALAETRYQFEREGYFCVDQESTDERLVFNQTVGLRESWPKDS